MAHHQGSKKTSAKLDRYTINFHNSEEYHRLKKEVFSEHLYYFETENAQPYILDAGAHIGMATLYFKKIFPGSHVTAIEPHPVSFQVLEQNVWDNNLDGVTCEQVALSTRSGRMSFYQDKTEERWYSTAGFVQGAWNGDQKSEEIMVEAKPLADYLTQPVDFLKMDIEGAEQSVLMAAAEHLHLIKHMIVEFHPHAHQDSKALTDFLEKQGFKLTLWKKGKKVQLAHVTGLFLIEAIR